MRQNGKLNQGNVFIHLSAGVCVCVFFASYKSAEKMRSNNNNNNESHFCEAFAYFSNPPRIHKDRPVRVFAYMRVYVLTADTCGGRDWVEEGSGDREREGEGE